MGSGAEPLGKSFIPYWFEMFDEPWKSNEGGQGPHWGRVIRTETRRRFPL